MERRRHRSRSVGAIRFFGPAAFGAVLAISFPLAAAPYQPSEDGEVLARSAVQDPRIGEPLREAQAKLRQHPENLVLALNVARQYITLGRSEGDPRYYGYAQAALSPWWTLRDAPLDVLVLRAVLRQANHEFDAALHDLEAVLQLDPTQSQAWLTRAVILQVQGRFADAVASCRQLSGRVAPLVSATCLAAARSQMGRAAESYRALSDALSETSKPEPQIKAWSQTVLGEIAARQGRPELAESHFRDALKLGVRSTYLLAAYADLLLDQDRFTDVRDLLKTETKVDALLLRLVLAERSLNSEAVTARRKDLSLRFAAGRRRGDSRHLREEARFLLEVMERPGEALRLARANWQMQREPWDSRLLLAAALEAGDPEAAALALQWLSNTGLEDVHIDRLVAELRKEKT